MVDVTGEITIKINSSIKRYLFVPALLRFLPKFGYMISDNVGYGVHGSCLKLFNNGVFKSLFSGFHVLA